MSYEWAKKKGFYEVLNERAIKVCMELKVSEVLEFVWSYEWANYKSLYGVISERTIGVCMREN